MHGFSIGVALLAALAIIAIGIMYVSRPRAATRLSKTAARPLGRSQAQVT